MASVELQLSRCPDVLSRDGLLRDILCNSTSEMNRPIPNSEIVVGSGTGGTAGSVGGGTGEAGILPEPPGPVGTTGVTMYGGAETEMMEAGCCITGQFGAGFSGGAT